MHEDDKAGRHEQIEQAAYDLLQARGYGGTSMLAIAKRAKASNETLYRWYGNKDGLFKAMVENNALRIKAALETAIADDAEPLVSLEVIAPILLSMLLGERAVSLNRAAASDESGQLGAVIAAKGRDAVFPLIAKLIQRGLDNGMLSAPSAGMAGEWFLFLLIGDQQVRRVIRTLPVPSEEAVRARSAAAITAFRRLCAA